MKGSEILLSTLKAQGLTTIYGIVGREAEVIMFNEVDGVDFILTRDERSAAFMADMQGRLTGKAGVCYSTFGPGATNLVTGVASAYTDRAPVLVIAAQVEQSNIHPSTHQYVDQVALMRPVVKYAKEITDINDLEEEIVRAVLIAESGLPGPCFLSIPLDLFKQDGVYKSISAEQDSLKNMSFPNDERIKGLADGRNSSSDIVTFLKASQNPVCIVGSNIWAEEEQTALNDLLNFLEIPAVTTYSGKRNLASRHRCYLGTVSKYLDSFTPGILREIFDDADAVIVIGLDMVEGVDSSLWVSGKSKRVCAINSLLKYDNHFKLPDLDLSVSLKEIWEYVKDNFNQTPFDGKKREETKKRIKKIQEQACEDKAGLNAFNLVRIINQVLGADDIVISDVGTHKQLMSLYYEAKKTDRFFCSNGLGSMGFGLPAAIGAKKTFSDKRVVAVCGDAGFHLSSHELETSVRCHLPIVCLVFCDASVGLIRHYQKKGFGKTNPGITDFGKMDFVKLAEANGCKGHRVFNESQLRTILEEALEGDITTVIEIPLEREKYIF